DPVYQLLSPFAARDRIEHELVVEAATDNHRSPIEEALGERSPAPHQDPVPLQTAFMRVELPPHSRMNTVAADQTIAAASEPRTRCVREPGLDGALRWREGAEGMPATHRGPTEALPYGIAQEALQVAAVDRELRHLIAGFHPARLAPYLLAEAVGIDQLAGAHRHLVEPSQQPQLGELGDRMR